ncbi:MAG: ATP-binding protein, partial [Candidatus Saccharimonas sp.]
MLKPVNNFIIDARTVLQLGRDSIKNPTTAVVELVKNSYDADATIVEVHIGNDSIRISDNGYGMSVSELTSRWLRIGFSEKRENKHTKNTRRKTGEKGIGRLSADRLGSNLRLRTKASGEDAYELNVTWDDFDVDGKSVSDIPVNVDISEAPALLSVDGTGTEISISNLRQRWLAANVEQLYVELSALLSPFSKQRDFEVKFTNEVLPELNGTVQSDYYEVAELSLKATYDVSSNSVAYSIVNRYDPANVKTVEHTMPWSQLSSQIDRSTSSYDSESLSCGPVDLEILFFPRSASNPLLKERGLTLPGLRNFLDKNAGIKIYRDNISVKPFGYNNEPAGDWLGLAQRKERDPAGLNRATYKVSSYQLVGAVSVGRDLNAQLRDGAAREGFVENAAFNDLRALALSCVVLLEKYRYEDALSRSKNEKKTVLEKTESYSDDLNNLQQDLEGLSSTLKNN